MIVHLLKLVSFGLLLLLSFPSLGQAVTTQDSITVFYESLLSNLEDNYLYRKEVDWNSIKKFTQEQSLNVESFEKSLEVSVAIFDSIKCNHCLLFPPEGFYGSTLNKSLSKDDFSEAFLSELDKQPPFDVKIINENIGYINIPGMLLIDLSQDSLNLKTQEMYDRVAQLTSNHNIKGWIVDLRFNIGGNVYPMLAALHPLIGDNIVYKARDAEGKIMEVNRLVNGGFYSGEKLEAEAIVSVVPNVDIPVAVITGKMTGSAGEDIAVAFKNRKNTVFIGGNSYGLLTGNDLAELPYDNQLAFTTCYIVDADEVYRSFIIPDIIISKKDNFDDLSKDENIIQAMNFFRVERE